jgi:hypothetical protein
MLGPYIFVQRHGLVRRRDLVIAVVLDLAHFEEEVELARCPHADPIGDEGVTH